MKIKMAAAGLALVTLNAYGRDDRLKFDLKEAMDRATNERHISPDIKFYFGSEKYPKPLKKFGTYTSNRKTNAFAKSDKEACQWVFFSALIALQKDAREVGGDAIVNVKSFYRDVIFESNTQFECGAGAIIAGVALQGDIVKLGEGTAKAEPEVKPTEQPQKSTSEQNAKPIESPLAKPTEAK